MNGKVMHFAKEYFSSKDFAQVKADLDRKTGYRGTGCARPLSSLKIQEQKKHGN